MLLRLYFLSSLLIALSGFFHILLHFLLINIFNSVKKETLISMQIDVVNLLGIKRSVYHYFEGFSITMGLFMIFYGGLNAVFYLKNKEVFDSAKWIFLANGILYTLILILSVLYFHIPPIFVFGFASILNLFLYFGNRKKVA